MATTENLTIRVRGDTRHAESSMKNLSKKSQDLLGQLGLLGGVAGFGLVAAESIKAASKIEGVQRAFDKLNQPGLLANLREATSGTVTDLELMRQAVRASNFNIPLQQLATFFKFASDRATETGESVDFLVNSIIDGIGRKSTLVMDNLGISASELQQEIKLTGDFGLASANIIARQMAKAGKVMETTETKTDRLAATFQNFTTNLALNFTPSIGAFSDKLTTFFELLEADMANRTNELGQRMGEEIVGGMVQGLKDAITGQSFLDRLAEFFKDLPTGPESGVAGGGPIPAPGLGGGGGGLEELDQAAIKADQIRRKLTPREELEQDKEFWQNVFDTLFGGAEMLEKEATEAFMAMTEGMKGFRAELTEVAMEVPTTLEFMADAIAQIGEAIQQTLGSTLITFTNTLQQAIASSESFFDAFLKSLLAFAQTVANIALAIGAVLVFFNPVAGVGIIAAATALKIGIGAAQGGINRRAERASQAQRVAEIRLRAQGRDLVSVIRAEEEAAGRTGLG